MEELKMEDTIAINVSNDKIVDDAGEHTAEFSAVKDELILGKHEKKKKPSLFRRAKKKSSEPVETQAVSEDEVRVFSASENPSVSDTQELTPDAPTQPIPELEQTRVLGDSDREDVNDKGTQMLLEGFEEERPKKEEMSDEDRLRRVRREQIEDFSQKREQHMHEVEEMQEQEQEKQADERGEVVYPETPLEVPTEESVESPVAEETAKEASERLFGMLRRCNVSLFFTVVFEVILFLLTLISAVSPVLLMGPATYLIVQLSLFVVLCGINLPLLSKGFSRLFIGKATAVSGVAVAVVVTLVHTALQFLNTTDLANGTTPLLTGVCGLGVLLLSVADRLEVERLYRASAFAVSLEESTAYKCVDDPRLAEEIGRPAVALGVPRVAYYRKTNAVCGFADDSSFSVPQMPWYLPITFGLSVLISLVYFVLNGISSWQTTLTLFCCLLNVCAPALLVFAMQTALFSAGSSARKEGVAIADYQSISKFGSVHALALDAMDIFPEESVLLHGIKTFSGTRIDDAILDAASVSVRAGGPLSHVFRRMIQNKVDMLRDVDTLVYEQDMGLSGWVSGRRVLIGNRKLLDNHGIDIPSRDYEQRYTVNGRQLVYLSIAGELSAMFVVSYIASPQIKQRLTELTQNRVTLLVRTCDQNITEQLIASTFDLDGFYVELLNAPAGRSFEGLVDGVSETEQNGVISDGQRCGLFRALTLCCRMRRGERVLTVLQTIMSLLLVGLIGYVALAQTLIFSPVYIADILLGFSLATAGGAFLLAKK